MAEPKEEIYNKEYRRIRRITTDFAIRQISVGTLANVINVKVEVMPSDYVLAHYFL